MENGTSEAPLTRAELKAWMETNCYSFNSYSVLNNPISEGHVLEQTGDGYQWYFTDHGNKDEVQTFKTEAEAVAHAFAHISADTAASAHCIGFTEDAKEHNSLAKILTGMGIKFSQNQIPFYGPKKPVYRTFVYGCDFRETEHLKERFYKRPE